MHFRNLDELREALRHRYPDETLVFGSGPCPCDLMIVGEAPGKDELEVGVPFVGMAGRNFDGFLSNLGLARENVYITNTVKYRPTKVSEKGRVSNRAPGIDEIREFRPFLEAEAALVRPRIVIGFGRTAARAAMGDDVGPMSKLHGRWQPQTVFGNARMFILYHPASIIYRPSLKETCDEDIAVLRRDLLREGAPLAPAPSSEEQKSSS